MKQKNSPRNFEMNCELVERLARLYEMEYEKLEPKHLEPAQNDALASKLMEMSHEEFKAWLYWFLKSQHEAGKIL